MEQLLLEFKSDVGVGPRNFFTEASANTLFYKLDTDQQDHSFSQANNFNQEIHYDLERRELTTDAVSIAGDGPVIWVSSGSAYALADMYTGELHAKAGASSMEVPYGVDIGFPADATAWLGDTLFFTNPGAGPTTVTTVSFSMHLEGSLNEAPIGYTTSGLPHGVLDVWVGQTPEYCPDGYCSVASPNVSPGYIVENFAGVPQVSTAIDDTYSASFSFQGPAAIVPIVAMLSVGGQFGWADFHDTAKFSFDALPDGVSYISASGVFLTGSSVPEPSSWALLLTGFAGIGYAAFRCRCTAARVS